MLVTDVWGHLEMMSSQHCSLVWSWIWAHPGNFSSHLTGLHHHGSRCCRPILWIIHSTSNVSTSAFVFTAHKKVRSGTVCGLCLLHWTPPDWIFRTLLTHSSLQLSQIYVKVLLENSVLGKRANFVPSGWSTDVASVVHCFNMWDQRATSPSCWPSHARDLNVCSTRVLPELTEMWTYAINRPCFGCEIWGVC